MTASYTLPPRPPGQRGLERSAGTGDRVGERAERARYPQVVAAAGQYADSLAATGQERPDQRGLPDPRLADDQRGPSGTRGDDLRDRLREDAQLGLAFEQYPHAVSINAPRAVWGPCDHAEVGRRTLEREGMIMLVPDWKGPLGEAFEHAIGYLDGLPERPVGAGAIAEELRGALGGPLPERSAAAAARWSRRSPPPLSRA